MNIIVNTHLDSVIWHCFDETVKCSPAPSPHSVVVLLSTGAAVGFSVSHHCVGKMATDWHGLALQQAEHISSRIREVLSVGIQLLKTELGVDLDVQPELFPTWIILSTAFIGVFVVVALAWLAACGGYLVGRKRGPNVSEPSSDTVKASVIKTIKPEEPKKKNKKRPADKKAQPNGRTASESPDELKPGEDTPKAQAGGKLDKAKKNKKKAKVEVKPAQTALPSVEGKEPDEGDWETMVSNKERRQQRKKEKSPNSGSPGGRDRAGHQGETAASATHTSSGSRKNRASSSWTEVSSVNGGGWADSSMKLGSPVSTTDSGNWTPMMKPAAHRTPETLGWTPNTDASWNSMDGQVQVQVQAELNPVNFVLGLNAGGESISQPSTDLQWDNLAPVDEWSAFNGLAPVDPTSDWNAPTELWGNYEEPAVDLSTPTAPPVRQQSIDSDEDKEKEEGGSAKSKKKKKKKKKQEEAEEADMESESPKPHNKYAAMGDAGFSKHSPPLQKNPEQSPEAPKQSGHKKRARRET
ncbi:metadherin a [Engraulis encrasicolus]|uniref:metadherin a n=1 Tax=Engraulis encrasicolus TaxID=184585 RepID=UPI002FD16A40